MYIYKAWNAAMATAAVQPKVTTGTVVKTMLQLSTPATVPISILSWGYSIDAAPAGIGVVELVQTDVAASVTAHVASGVQPQDGSGPASRLTLGASNTGFTASAEGTVTATRTFDAVTIPNGLAVPNPYYQVFTPKERPIVPISKFLRVRVTFAAAVNMSCWICWEE
jgi:hypothetical protein